MHKLLISIWLNQVLVFSSSQVFFPDSFGSQECVALTPTCSSSLPSSQDLSQAAPAMEFPKCSLSMCTGGVWAASRVSGRSLCCTTCSPLRADNREFSDVSLDEQIVSPAHSPIPVTSWLLCKHASPGWCAEGQCVSHAEGGSSGSSLRGSRHRCRN